MAAADAETISLRPLSLRPGGGAVNPFAGFAKGAGAGLKKVGAGRGPGLHDRGDHAEAPSWKPTSCSARQACDENDVRGQTAVADGPAGLQLGPGHQKARRQWRLHWRQHISTRCMAMHQQHVCQRGKLLGTHYSCTTGTQQPAAERHCCQTAGATWGDGCFPCRLQAVSSAPADYTERKKKPPGEVIRYSRDFLMKFVQVGDAALPPGGHASASAQT